MRHVSRLLMLTATAATLMMAPVGGALHTANAASRAGIGVAPRANAVVAHSRAGAKARDGSAGQGYVVASSDGKVQLFMQPDYVAQIVGVDTATLQQDLQAGQTLLQIAGSRYASANDLATALLARFKTKMDYAVTNGGMSATQESQIYGSLLSAAQTLVTTPHPQLASPDDDAAGPSAEKRAQSGGVNIKATLFSAVVTACNTTMDALSAALAPGGKSILQICQATNPSVTLDSLATAVTAAIKAQLDAAVSAGTLPAAQEGVLLTKLGQGIDNWLTTPIGKQGDQSGTKA